jgi:hypothetical protein
MARYRIYQFNIAGHVTATRAVECTSDDEAIRASDQWDEDAPLQEVWLGGRRITRTSVRSTRKRAGRMSVSRL